MKKSLVMFLYLASSVYLVLFLVHHLSGVESRVDYIIPLDIVVFIVSFIFYMKTFRGDNLLCLELFVSPILFIGLFFDDAMANGFSDFAGFSISSDYIRIKSHYLQMIAYLIFLAGSSSVNLRYSYLVSSCSIKKELNEKKHDYKRMTKFLSFILLLLLVYDYYSGVFSTWFFYANRGDFEGIDRNQGLGHITCLSLAVTVSEFSRLLSLEVNDFRSFVKQCDKLYIIEILVISSLLIVSGNRNEMLLIFLPPVVAYTLYINKIPNRYLLFASLAGLFIMVIVGLTRLDGVSLNASELNLFAFIRDFGDVGYTNDYMIEWTDQHSPVYFKIFILTILSGIPLLGPLLIQFLNIEVVPSVVILNASVMYGSFGSTLIGDLYYTGGFIFVILFMLLLGRYMSKLYNLLNYTSYNNTYVMTFYTYMVANGVYYVRSSWDFPLTIIIYVWVILYLCKKIFKNPY